MLGPIEALEGGEPLAALGAPKQRAVLARAPAPGRNEVVTRDALADAVWGESVPGSAVQLASGVRPRAAPRARRRPHRDARDRPTGCASSRARRSDLDRFEELRRPGARAHSPPGRPQDAAAAVAPGARALVGRAARRPRGRAGRPTRPCPAAGRPARGGHRAARRRGAGTRAPRGARPGGRGARRRALVPRAAARAARHRPLPLRPAEGGARGPACGTADVRRRVGVDPGPALPATSKARSSATTPTAGCAPTAGPERFRATAHAGDRARRPSPRSRRRGRAPRRAKARASSRSRARAAPARRAWRWPRRRACAESSRTEPPSSISHL